jgi:hypothetical protein
MRTEAVIPSASVVARRLALVIPFISGPGCRSRSERHHYRRGLVDTRHRVFGQGRKDLSRTMVFLGEYLEYPMD